MNKKLPNINKINNKITANNKKTYYSFNNERQEKLAMTKYTYEQVLAIRAEQVYGKVDNSSNSALVNQIRKNDNVIDIIPKDKKINVV